MAIEVNELQTQITDMLLESLPKEIRDDLLDAITNIEFIKRLVSPTRLRAKDLPRDKKGRIIVDIANPHILENMDYFRETGLYFKEHKKYTKLKPNANPNSEFSKWLDREVDRIWNGMVRESDGEWIPGQLYFYLNYMPIIQSKIRPGTKIADKVVDLPEIWDGVYLWFHYLDQGRNGGLYNAFEGGQHGVQIAKRGASKSYSCASMLARMFICGDNELAIEETRGVILAYDKEKLTKDGTLNKFISCINHCAIHTEFPSNRLKSSLAEMTWTMGYIDPDDGIEKGTKNTTLGVTVGDDEDKARGKRANLFLYEEFGAFPGFLDVWRTNFRSVQEGDISFGQAVAIGTGGSKGSSFEGALEMIYNPIGYNVYPLPNVFDKNSQGKQQCVFFYGAYLNRKGLFDADGNSDVIGALLQIFRDRYRIKYNTSDPLSLTQAKAEDPITIQEAIMKREGTIYPVSDLTDRLNEIDFDPHSLDDILVGLLSINKENTIVYKPDSNVKPNREFPHKDNKLEGAIEIHATPVFDSSGKIPRGRYIAGIDPYDDDVSQTLSLGSIIILDLWTDKIVFEYTGRPLFADDFYEICRRALLWYNAEANYENNKKGLFTYFSRHNCLYLLSDILEFLKDKDENLRHAYGNKAKGTMASAPIKSYARTAIRNWLLKPVKVTVIEDNEEKEIEIRSLYLLKSRALIKELISWNPDGNFDRHDALGMLMLLREDKLRIFGVQSPSEAMNKREDKDLANDDFFKKNYRKASHNNKFEYLNIQ